MSSKVIPKSYVNTKAVGHNFDWVILTLLLLILILLYLSFEGIINGINKISCQFFNILLFLTFFPFFFISVHQIKCQLYFYFWKKVSYPMNNYFSLLADQRIPFFCHNFCGRKLFQRGLLTFLLFEDCLSFIKFLESIQETGKKMGKMDVFQ